MNLIIAEKPEVGRAIAATLSKNAINKKGYIELPDCDSVVSWAVGHLMREQEPHDYDERYKQWSLDDLPLAWPPFLLPNESTKAQLNTLKRLIKQCNEVTNGCDVDAAGQQIFDSIMQYVGCNKPQHRVLITDNNRIAKAFKDKRDNADYHGLGLNERGRAIADLRYGVNLSRVLSLQAEKQGYQGRLHTGRVQASFLGLAVRRERTIQYFKPEHYYLVTADIEKDGCSLTAFRLQIEDSSITDEKGRIVEEHDANIKSGILNNSIGNIIKVETKELEEHPPLPYELGSLQSDCNDLFGFAPDKVMKLTQSLRDKHKAITYNRSDNPYLPEEMHPEAPELLNELSTLEEFEYIVHFSDETIKSRAFDNSKNDAHHAIIPTMNLSGIEEMTDQEFDVYVLIVRNYIAQFYPKRRKRQFTYTVECQGELLVGKKLAIIDHGWEVLFKGEPEDSEEDKAALDLLNHFQEGDDVTLTSHSTAQSTKPPPSYTIASFLRDTTQVAKYVVNETIKQMLLDKDKGKAKEKGGIGTSATRSEIFKKMVANGVFEVSGKKLRPTAKGYMLHDALPPSAVSPEMTAIWSHKQSQIENGELSIPEFVDYIDKVCAEEVAQIKKGINIPQAMTASAQQQTLGQSECVYCDNDSMQKKPGRYGAYWQCSECKKTAPDFKGKPFKPMKCDKCGSDMAPRKGKKGMFIGCKGYKDGCDNIIFD